MEYRRLGKAGVKVSQLSLGSWVTFGKQVDLKSAVNLMSASKEFGVNFYDNAEVYAGGKSEEIMGLALKELKWDRSSYLISTKFFWGIIEGVNTKNTLNRKYLVNAMPASLKRLGLDYVDLVYCHRPDPNTPMEEIVWSMHSMIERGQALYWGTSEWSAKEIMEAWTIADKCNLHKPVVEQPQYHLFHRDRVEIEYKDLYEKIGIGLTTWSPLASGVLTGKYLNGIPAGTRASNPGLSFVHEMATDEKIKIRVKKFVTIAEDLKVTPAALAIAWCSSNKNVSTVITGASTIDQMKQNILALDALKLLTPEKVAEINRI